MVNIDNKVIELIKFLPHGSRSIIAQDAGVSKTTVTKFFNKKKLSYKKGRAIFLSTLKFYNEVKSREMILLKQHDEEQKEIDEIIQANLDLIK